MKEEVRDEIIGKLKKLDFRFDQRVDYLELEDEMDIIFIEYDAFDKNVAISVYDKDGELKEKIEDSIFKNALPGIPEPQEIEICNYLLSR